MAAAFLRNVKFFIQGCERCWTLGWTPDVRSENRDTGRPVTQLHCDTWGQALDLSEMLRGSEGRLTWQPSPLAIAELLGWIRGQQLSFLTQAGSRRRAHIGELGAYTAEHSVWEPALPCPTSPGTETSMQLPSQSKPRERVQVLQACPHIWPGQAKKGMCWWDHLY